LRGVDVPASELSAAEVRALEPYATRARGAPPRSAEGRDLLTYELELDTDEGPVRLEFDELSVPEDLSALVSSLAKRARPGG
jgi:hypothetical protein